MKKPTSTVPPRAMQDSMHDAQEGPPESRQNAITHVPCPLCRGLGLVLPMVALWYRRLRAGEPPTEVP